MSDTFRKLTQQDINKLAYFESSEWRDIQSKVIEREAATCQKCKGHGTEVCPQDSNNWHSKDLNLFELLCIQCQKVKKAVRAGIKGAVIREKRSKQKKYRY